jgi:hypothetical protein
MGLFKKKADPISDRTKALNAEIAALQAQIKKLSASIDDPQPSPRIRSNIPFSAGPAGSQATQANSREPIFEEIDRERLKTQTDSVTAHPRNDSFGGGKPKMTAAWQRFLNYFRGPPPSNPKLMNYLAAGSIQGLRPLRYEKRVARYRLLFLCLCLVFAVWIIIEWIRHH